jgi:hypothetical protein
MLYCYFGWGGASYAFGVFSRAMQAIISKVIVGILKIYVDDLMGASHHTSAAADQAAAQSKLRAFFGPNAVAPKSILPTSTADILGWRINLVRQSIRPSDRGCRKLFWAFSLVPTRDDTGAPIRWQLALCQLIASLANRYSLALRGMTMFVQPLNDLLKSASQADRTPTSSARFAVEVWRTVGCILAVRPDDLAIPLRHLVPTSGTIATYALVTDAGPTCVGIALFETNDATQGGTGRCIAFTDFPLNGWNEVISDPRYQNTREFCGALLGLLLIMSMQEQHRLPPGPVHLHWHGDNTSALSWIFKNRMTSAQTQYIFMAYTWLRLRTPHDIPWCSHKPGHTMGDVDRLSRQQRLRALDPAQRVEFVDTPSIASLFRLIDPATPPQRTANDHHAAFMAIYDHISTLIVA